MKLVLGGIGLVALVMAALLPACGAGVVDATYIEGEGGDDGWEIEEAGGDGAKGEGVEVEGAGLNRYSGPARAADPDTPGGWVTIQRGGQPRTVRYEVIEGEAVIEGDVVLGELADVINPRKGLVRNSGQWSGRRVPYLFASNVGEAQQRNVTSAMNTWTNATGIVFERSTSARDVVVFSSVSGVCQAPVGRVGGRQRVSLDPDRCDTAAILHEIGHTLGLQHEHTRSDRARSIDFHADRVFEDDAFNFHIGDVNEYDDVGDLDFSSIMMYDSFAFAAIDDGRTPCKQRDRGCKPVLTRKGTEDTWVAASRLSQGDIRAVLGLYPTFEQPIVVSSLAARTPVRRFADGVAGNRFCVEQGYRRMTAEASASRDVGTVVATFNSSTGRWTGERTTVRVGVYTSITCGF